MLGAFCLTVLLALVKYAHFSIPHQSGVEMEIYRGVRDAL